jgi:hypothetical protein
MRGSIIQTQTLVRISEHEWFKIFGPYFKLLMYKIRLSICESLRMPE